MNRNINALLPIGSVVRLRGAEKRLMIYGVCQTNHDDEQEYDYIGVLYPEGNIGSGFQPLFNHADVEQVCFVGYEDREREAFLRQLAQFSGEAHDMT